MPNFYKPDGSDFSGAPLDLEAGAGPSSLELELWHSRTEPEGEPVSEILVLAETWDSVDLVWRRDALPPQVEQWLECRCVGQVAESHPEQLPFVSDWVPVGYGQALALPPIFPDCGRQLEVRIRVPATAAAGAWQWRLVALSDEHASPLAGVEPGILTGYGSGGRTWLLRGGRLEVSSPPSAEIEIPARLVCFAGTPIGFSAELVELDQVDGSAEDLEAGEAYLAGLAQGAGDLLVIKGARSALPLYPAVPAGRLLLAWVRVDHDVATVIDEADVLLRAEAGRMAPRAGDGLEVILGPGEAHGGGTARWWVGATSVPVPDDGVSTVWQLPTGRYDVAAAMPMSGALPIARVTAAAGELSGLEDLRPFKGRLHSAQFGGAAPGAAPAILGYWICPVDRAIVDRVRLVVDDNGGGTSGKTLVDVELAGVSMFPGGDGCPEIQFDADRLVAEGGIPTGPLELRDGEALVARLLELPAGGSPGFVTVIVDLVEVW